MTDWDILNIDEEEEWTHIQIRDRLNECNIDCYFADMWVDDMAFLIGCNASDYQIAKALGIHRECIYNDFEHCFVILNLFQEKYLRGLLKD